MAARIEAKEKDTNQDARQRQIAIAHVALDALQQIGATWCADMVPAVRQDLRMLAKHATDLADDLSDRKW